MPIRKFPLREYPHLHRMEPVWQIYWSISTMPDVTQYVGIAAGICTATSMLPQLIKIFKKKKADDISYLMLIVLLAGLGLWVWYGCLKSDIPIIATNVFSLLVNVTILILSVIYKKRSAAQ